MKRKLAFTLALLMIACIVPPASWPKRAQSVNDAQYSPIDITKAEENDTILRLNRMGAEPPWVQGCGVRSLGPSVEAYNL